MNARVLERLERRVRRVWASDVARLFLLTLYYLGLIAGLAAVHGHPTLASPPFVYQGF